MPEDARVERIVEKVRRREQAVEPLKHRMDKDYALYRLVSFTPDADDGIIQKDAFTSNQPRVDADKIIAFIASANLNIRVANDDATGEQRAVNNNTERLTIGMFNHLNKRLSNVGKPRSLQAALGWHAVVRGSWIAARALLRKFPNGDTWEDVVPVDPRQLVFEMGEHEPIWAATITMRSRTQIRDQYPDFKFENESHDMDDANTQERVIDYYETQTLKNGNKRYLNSIIIGDKFAKKPYNTFAERFPIVMRLVGYNSGVAPFSLASGDVGAGMLNEVKTIEDVGETFFAANRGVVQFRNRTMSYRMALTRKAVSGTYKVYSTDGMKELEQDLVGDGEDIQLSTSNNEELKLLELPQLLKDADVLDAAVAVEGANGGLPDQAHGRLPAPISGNALRILGATIGEKLNPYLEAVESCLEGVAEALLTQYETERYRKIHVAGRTRSREEFSRQIGPEDIEDHGPVTITLTAHLPEDNQEKWMIAGLASRPGPGGEPLASGRFIRDDILNMQDGDLENERIYSQMARVSTPMTLLMTQLEAAVRDGDEKTAHFLWTEIEKLREQAEMEHMMRLMAFLQMMQQAGPIGAMAMQMRQGQQAPQQNGNGESPGAGIPPEVMGLSGTMFGQNSPSPEAGANTTGPRSVDDRLAAAGLERGR